DTYSNCGLHKSNIRIKPIESTVILTYIILRGTSVPLAPGSRCDPDTEAALRRVNESGMCQQIKRKNAMNKIVVGYFCKPVHAQVKKEKRNASTQCVLAVLHVHASETCTFFPWRYSSCTSSCSSQKCLVPYATCSKGVEVCIRPSYRLFWLVFKDGRKLRGKKTQRHRN
ncbi:hypothetical protein PO909_016786, partial [Leuciscus waleckii]